MWWNKAEAGFTITELLIVVAIMGFAMAAVLGIYQVTQQTTLFAGAGEEAQVVARGVIDRLVADLQLINAGRTESTGAVPAATPTSITFLGDVDNSLDTAGAFITLSAQANVTGTALTVTAPASGTDLTKLFPCGSEISVADGAVRETQVLLSSGCVSGTTLNLSAGLGTFYPAGSLVRAVERVSYAWDSATEKLCRKVAADCSTPFSDDDVIATNVKSFALAYSDSAGTSIASSSLTTTAVRDTIRAIQVQISIQSQSGNQTVTRKMAVTAKPRNFLD